MATKIVQGESRTKRKTSGFSFFYAEPQPIFCKDSARREQDKKRSQWIFFFHAEPQPIFCKDSARREKGKMKNHVFQIVLILAILILA